ncbi:MAG: putative 4-hydroxybenzoate polyprenyltransferase [Pirellulales bacterium]|nr:putative 4-hydroxybenzoate polyprenyltransferase [Pirellulales bacterium]
MFATVRHFLSLVRFSHTLFALPFALLAMLMAAAVRETRTLSWRELMGVVFCMVTARSAAMAFNRLADRDIDALNPRTAGRHLPAGVLSVPQVAALAIACSLAFVASTLLFLPNRLPLGLSLPVLAFLLGYSYTKRYTALAHFWLGAALALSPMAAWIAVRGEQVAAAPTDLLPAAVLGLAVLTWVAGFDVIYACQDVDFDRQARLHSIPVRFGVAGALRLAAGLHLATIAALAALPLVYPPFGWIYGAGVAAVAVLLVYEHALVRPDDLSRVNAAFFNVNAVISLGLLAVGIVDLVLG